MSGGYLSGDRGEILLGAIPPSILEAFVASGVLCVFRSDAHRDFDTQSEDSESPMRVAFTNA
jgi:hypothetical protein